MYVSKEKTNSFDDTFLNSVVKLLDLDHKIEKVPVTSEDSALLKKSVTGRFPVLEQASGIAVCEVLPISRVLSKKHPTFYGIDENYRGQVDMWTDYINSTVVPAAQRVIAQCDGTAKVQMDVKNFSIALTELKNALANLENHLKLRFYLVGHSLTLADVFLVSVLVQTFSLAIDKKTRDALLPNLTRYVTLAA